MSNSDSSAVTTPSTTPNSTHKHHSRTKRKKRTSATTKMITIIDHNDAPKYAKQPDPDAPMITRPCTECGKKFWSWKALFGHMRCHPERQWRGINPPPNFQRQPPSDKQPLEFMTAEDHEIAASLLLLANPDGAGPSVLNGRFECSSCKKVFGSHQALGGHRASHKNVKGCFASGMTNDEEDDEMVMALEGHKCSVCLRVFSSGQALGGHMRCHWDKGDPEPQPEASITHHHHHHHHHALITNQGCGLDLNLPPPLQHDSSSPLTLDLRLGL